MLNQVMRAASLIGFGIMIGRLLSEADAGEAGHDNQSRVRNAGPDEMDSPPARWDNVDQQADESFPASDPPGNY